MNWYKIKISQSGGPQGVMVDTEQQWGREKERKYLRTYDVSKDNPNRLASMSLALNAILSHNPPIETEELRDYFDKIKREVYTGEERIPTINSISDLLSPAKVVGDHILLEYRETTGKSTLGKLLWSFYRWMPNVMPNFLREDRGKRQGLIYSILMKSGILPRVEQLMITELTGILQKAMEWGIISGFNPQEWQITSSNIGRDIIIRPTK
ncbi:MAG: hypothetical protein GF329_15810 [Candidatus Lokiarchaeota archaeon]|nr:hypothetical protein [Candidatus Lokiarchaeota archaeon]